MVSIRFLPEYYIYLLSRRSSAKLKMAVSCLKIHVGSILKRQNARKNVYFHLSPIMSRVEINTTQKSSSKSRHDRKSWPFLIPKNFYLCEIIAVSMIGVWVWITEQLYSTREYTFDFNHTLCSIDAHLPITSTTFDRGVFIAVNVTLPYVNYPLLWRSNTSTITHISILNSSKRLRISKRLTLSNAFSWG